jgi:hypothetical protein
MNQLDRIYKVLKQGDISFKGAHDIHTPRTLVEEILSKISLDGNILVMFNVEFIASLVYSKNVNPKNITLFSDHDNKNLIAEKIGVNYINKLEDKMKFDVVLMNPPYTSGQVMLYTKFFEKALDIGKTVVSVMPLDLSSRHDKLKFHNKRVHQHQTFISDNISDYFKVAYDNLHYVIADKSVKNEIKEIVDPLDSIPLSHTNRKRLQPIKGDTDSAIGDDVVGGVDVIFKVHKNDTVLYKKVDIATFDKSNKKSTAPFLVVVNHTPSKGRFNCAVLPNTGMTWGMWVFAFEVNSLDEGNKLKDWLQSSEIVTEIDNMLKARNNQHTISKAMIERLPWYE